MVPSRELPGKEKHLFLPPLLEINVYKAALTQDLPTQVQDSIVQHIQQPNDVTQGLVLEAYARVHDWKGAEDYWKTQQEQPQFTWTPHLLQRRLRLLGMQGKATQAEQLLKDSDTSLLTPKAWVHVLRAYASTMGRKQRKDYQDDDHETN